MPAKNRIFYMVITRGVGGRVPQKRVKFHRKKGKENYRISLTRCVLLGHSEDILGHSRTF